MNTMTESTTLTEEQKVLDMDANTLAKMIAHKQITSYRATEIYIEQINKINPVLNFLVENRFEAALNEASEADQLLKENKGKGKLFGVPMSMKESFDVIGMQTTGGLLNRKGLIQTTDSDVVQKLKDEGAIILGKTNTPALCFCQETDNKIYGRTNNPWDVTCTAGGSSGGEGVLIAVGGATAGVGSDIGGSIRFPSHFNGVVGFKSGRGQVSSTGSFPVENNELEKRMLGIGPITKTVEDAKYIYNIIANTPAPDQNLSNYSVSVLPKMDYPLSAETEALVDSVFSYVKDHFETDRSIPPLFKETTQLWQEIMSIDSAKKQKELAYGDKPIRPIRSFINEKVRGKSDLHHYLSWALIGASLFKPSDQRINEITEIIASGDKDVSKYLHDKILISPVYHSTAPKHGGVFKEIFSIRKTFRQYLPYISYANVWGLPSLTVPVGKDNSGMPIGIQLMCKNGNEDAVFQLGEQIEKEFLGYVRYE
ncbi:amidase [Sporosarcina siberiensis]|uniref:Amidase n=1 Tax=Sporosarcina siberiensis TaxID=1365606 RepID=A0ABW4SEP3_9BACL